MRELIELVRSDPKEYEKQTVYVSSGIYIELNENLQMVKCDDLKILPKDNPLILPIERGLKKDVPEDITFISDIYHFSLFTDTQKSLGLHKRYLSLSPSVMIFNIAKILESANKGSLSNIDAMKQVIKGMINDIKFINENYLMKEIVENIGIEKYVDTLSNMIIENAKQHGSYENEKGKTIVLSKLAVFIRPSKDFKEQELKDFMLGKTQNSDYLNDFYKYKMNHTKGFTENDEDESIPYYGNNFNSKKNVGFIIDSLETASRVDHDANIVYTNLLSYNIAALEDRGVSFEVLGEGNGVPYIIYDLIGDLKSPIKIDIKKDLKDLKELFDKLPKNEKIEKFEPFILEEILKARVIREDDLLNSNIINSFRHYLRKLALINEDVINKMMTIINKTRKGETLMYDELKKELEAINEKYEKPQDLSKKEKETKEALKKVLQTDEAYYYLMGQIIGRLIRASEAKKKDLLLAQTLKTLNAHNLYDVLQRLMRKYHYNVAEYDFKYLFSAVDDKRPKETLSNSLMYLSLCKGTMDSSIFPRKQEIDKAQDEYSNDIDEVQGGN